MATALGPLAPVYRESYALIVPVDSGRAGPHHAVLATFYTGNCWFLLSPRLLPGFALARKKTTMLCHVEFDGKSKLTVAKKGLVLLQEGGVRP